MENVNLKMPFTVVLSPNQKFSTTAVYWSIIVLLWQFSQFIRKMLNMILISPDILVYYDKFSDEVKKVAIYFEARTKRYVFG